jgi:hypothetical protein
LGVTTAVTVLQTAAKRAAYWRSRVTALGPTACLRSQVKKGLARSGEQLISLRQIPFPHVAPKTRAYRIVYGAAGARAVLEVVLIGKSRTYVSLSVVARYDQRSEVSAAALRYAKIIAARIRA